MGNPKSFLSEFRKEKTVIDKRIVESPPVTKQLISWLDKEFPREPVKVNDPMMAQKLTVRRGMDIILDHLRITNDTQESGIRSQNLADHPNRLIKKSHEEVLLKGDPTRMGRLHPV